MARYYRLSRSITQEEARKILAELSGCPDVKSAKITEDGSYLLVDTEDGALQEVMTRAVNICSRAAEGCGLAFARFAV